MNQKILLLLNVSMSPEARVAADFLVAASPSLFVAAVVLLVVAAATVSLAVLMTVPLATVPLLVDTTASFPLSLAITEKFFDSTFTQNIAWVFTIVALK